MPKRDHVGGRLVARDRQDDRQRDQLLAVGGALAQLLPDQVVQRALAGCPALAVDQLAQVRLQSVAGVLGVGGPGPAQQATGLVPRKRSRGRRKGDAEAARRSPSRGTGSARVRHQFGGAGPCAIIASSRSSTIPGSRAQGGGAFEGTNSGGPSCAGCGVRDRRHRAGRSYPVAYGGEARRVAGKPSRVRSVDSRWSASSQPAGGGDVRSPTEGRTAVEEE